MGPKAGLTLRGFDRAIGHAPRLVQQTKQQTSATYGAVGPAAMTDDSPRRLMLEELLALSDSVQRLARLADLRQHPSGGGDCPRKMDGDISCPEHRDPVLDRHARLGPVALVEVEHAGSEVGPTE